MDKNTLVFCLSLNKAKALAHAAKGEYAYMMMHPIDLHTLIKRFKTGKVGPLFVDKSMIVGWSLQLHPGQAINVDFDDDFKAAYPEGSPERIQAMARVRDPALADLSGGNYSPLRVGELDDGGE